MHRHRGRAVLVGAVLCAWCGWASGFQRGSAPARVTWALSLATVVVVDVLLWRGGRRRRPGWRIEPSRRPWPPAGAGRGRVGAGLAPWVALVLVALGWDVLALDTGRHRAHLTISALSQAFRPLNAALLLVWILAGVGYGAARARAPVAAAPPRGAAGDDPAPGGGFPGPVAAAPGVLLVLRTGAVRLAPPVPALLLPSSRGVGVAFWLAAVAVGVAIDVAARRSDGRLADAEQLVRFITAPVVANVVVVAAWGYAGYHLFAA